MATSKTPSIPLKKGDDFKLDLTVQDKNNTTAITNYTILEAAQKVLNQVTEADPQVIQDVIDAQAAVVAAQVAYDLSIIVDISGWVMASQVRWCGKLVDALVVTILNATVGTFSISMGSANTALWDTRKLDCDIEFTRPTGKVSSQTFIIDVKEDVTK